MCGVMEMHARCLSSVALILISNATSPGCSKKICYIYGIIFTECDLPTEVELPGAFPVLEYNNPKPTDVSYGIGLRTYVEVAG
jgi:hypothetical protein